VFKAHRLLLGLSNTPAIWPYAGPLQLFLFPLSALESAKKGIIKHRIRFTAKKMIFKNLMYVRYQLFCHTLGSVTIISKALVALDLHEGSWLLWAQLPWYRSSFCIYLVCPNGQILDPGTFSSI
jgi:hypothetical protein